MLFPRIVEWGRVQPDRTALLHDDRRTTYAEFAATLAAARAFFVRQALSPDRPIVVLAANLREAWTFLIALQALGFDTVWVRAQGEAAALDLLDFATVVTTPADQAALDLGPHSWPGARIIVLPPLPADPPPSAVDASSDHPPNGEHVLYTSGTTGTYKKVLWDGAANPKRFEMMARAREYDNRTIYHASNFGLWTAAGFAQPASVWLVGGCVIFDQRADYEANFFRHAITHAAVPPHDLKGLLAVRASAPEPVPGLKIYCTGGFLSPDAAEQAVSRIADHLILGFGATECLMILRQRFATKDDLQWLTPYPGRIVEVVDADGRVCADGETGELRVSLTDIDCTGYIGDPEASAMWFRGGYFYPGDLAVRRADGRIRTVGRIADVLNIRGHKVAAGPIEEVVRQRLQAKSVCIFTRQDNEGREQIAVAIESAQEPPSDDIAALREHFAADFEDVYVIRLAAFPREAAGMRKVRRRELSRVAFNQGDAGRSAGPG